MNHYIVLKLDEGVQIPYTDDFLERAPAHGFDRQAEILKERSCIVRRAFTALEPSRLEQLMAAAAEVSRSQPGNLLSYYRIRAGAAVDAEALAKALSRLPHVETACVQAPIVDAVEAADDVLAAEQEYLDAAPVGIDARYAWTVAGGDGAGTNFVTVQGAWMWDHEDLRQKKGLKSPVSPLFGVNLYQHNIPDPPVGIHEANRGTQVLGTICGDDNQLGVVGIAPNTFPRMASASEKFVDLGDAILTAADAMNAGDVLLLPLQWEGRKKTKNGLTFVELLPVEIEPLNLIAIQAAVGKGIIVVEGAGNGVVVRNANNKNIANASLDLTDPNILANIGGVDLDKYTDSQRKSVLNRSSSDLTDSGAIVVGAAFAASTHYRADLRYVAALGESILNWSGTGSNYGSRVDCYASGQRVRTTVSYDEADPNHKRYGRSEQRRLHHRS